MRQRTVGAAVMGFLPSSAGGPIVPFQDSVVQLVFPRERESCWLRIEVTRATVDELFLVADCIFMLRDIGKTFFGRVLDLRTHGLTLKCYVTFSNAFEPSLHIVFIDP